MALGSLARAADTCVTMRIDPSLEDQEQLADTKRRAKTALTGSESLAEGLVACAFAAACAGLWLIHPPGAVALPAGLLSMVVMVLATRVSFETPFGFTVATQLAFVPLLFSLPPAIVPIAVVVALAFARVPDVIAGREGVRRLLATPANAWFAIGPALVFALAGGSPQALGPLVLVVALAAQFSVDFAASAVYFAIAREASLRAQWRESWVYLIDAALSGVGLTVAEELHAAPYAVLAVVPLLGLLAVFAHERSGRLENLLELNDTYRGTALLLGDVISADDGYTGDHSQGVVGLALKVGARLGLSPERRRNLEFGALLHDVGKIAVPKEIINKPGKLDPEEWEIIKSHTTEGERMLRHVGGFMSEVGRIVRSHHERWDGGGYPDGLREQRIPIESRIVSCCDAWDAMRTDRSYRKALSHEVAVARMLDAAGSQFDPEVVAALIAVVGAGEPAGALEPVAVPAAVRPEVQTPPPVEAAPQPPPAAPA
jgi:putative nucleotidyltransferase with HDIG domain